VQQQKLGSGPRRKWVLLLAFSASESAGSSGGKLADWAQVSKIRISWQTQAVLCLLACLVARKRGWLVHGWSRRLAAAAAGCVLLLFADGLIPSALSMPSLSSSLCKTMLLNVCMYVCMYVCMFLRACCKCTYCNAVFGDDVSRR